MATIIRMPEVLANTAEAALQAWLVGEGETVSIGQPLAEVETEKAMVEYNAEVEGTLLRHLVEPGVSVVVGAPIAVIGAAGETDVDLSSLLAAEGITPVAPAPVVPAQVESAPDAGPDAGPDAAPAPIEPTPSTAESEKAVDASSSAAASTGAETSAPGARQFASPIVRRLARERGIDLSSVTGSGPDGRVVRRDLDGLEPATSAPGPEAGTAPAATPAPAASSAGYTDIPHTGMRRAIARRLTESKSTVPHFYLTANCRVDKLLELRRTVNESASRKLSVNDFVVKAVAGALKDVPAANAIWTETATRRFDQVDLAIAVSTETGLLTPVLRGVDGMSLTTISETVADLAERARSGKLKQHELEGGSFSVSNLGMYGVDEFSAILNPPQSGILAVGAAKQQAVVEDGELAIGTVMTVTISADHRVLDGALAAEWLAAFVKRIENPLLILI